MTTHAFPAGSVLITQAGRDLVGRLLTWFQGTRWTHCVLVTGEGTFLESQPNTGVVERPLEPFMAQLDTEGRAWVLLDQPDLTPTERAAIVTAGRGFLGRRYDYVQAGLWFLTHGFWSDGELRVICSRLLTAAFRTGAPRVAVFSDAVLATLNSKRAEDLRAGYCTPLTLYELSTLPIRSLSDSALSQLPPRTYTP